MHFKIVQIIPNTHDVKVHWIDEYSGKTSYHSVVGWALLEGDKKNKFGYKETMIKGFGIKNADLLIFENWQSFNGYVYQDEEGE